MAQVLIIDRDPAMLRMLRLVLCTSGFTVRTAHDQSGAMRILERERFSAILLDLGESSERFVSESRRRGVIAPIILMATRTASERHVSAPVVYLPKPFRPDALIDLAHAVTHIRRAS